MSNDLTSRLVADHALLIEKRLQDWQDGFRAGQEAMREAADNAALSEPEPDPAEMPAEAIAKVLAQDTVYVAEMVTAAVRCTKREIGARIRSLPIKDAPDE